VTQPASSLTAALAGVDEPWYVVLMWNVRGGYANVVDDAVRGALKSRRVAYPIPRVAIIGLPYVTGAAEIYGALDYINGQQFPGTLDFMLSPIFGATHAWSGQGHVDWQTVNAVTGATKAATPPIAR
jgi:hypothetical protein